MVKLACALLLALSLFACADAREPAHAPPVYENNISRLLAQRCKKCHGPGADDDAGAGFVIGTYLETLGCPINRADGGVRADAGAHDAPGQALLDVLDRPDHATYLDAPERARVRAWLAADAPLRDNAVHEGGILNPRSAAWHGRLAARDHYGPLLDAAHPDACGRCHDGAPVRPKGITHPAAGAPACTSCHTQPAGVLACGTCHGDGGARAYPPRDGCLFADQKLDAHRAHLETSAVRTTPLVCGTCHAPADATLSGTHANGHVDVVFDAALAGPDASYDPKTGVCAVRCHAQKGARSSPSFAERKPFGCGDCHGAPPKNHYAGACNRCHLEANASGTKLLATRLHMNGVVDIGDGKGGCSFCHGKDGDPMPQSPSHLLHAGTQLTAAIACAECHVVPKTVQAAGHLDRGAVTAADVTFGARAKARGQVPVYAAHTCKNVACHGAGLSADPGRVFEWDAHAGGTCTTCHGTPPAPPHPADSGCASLICHGTEIAVGVAGPKISGTGRANHIDGTIETQQP